MAQISKREHSILFFVVLAAFIAFVIFVSRSTAQCSDVVLKDTDGCAFRLTKEEQNQKIHLYRLDAKKEILPREMSLKLLGEDGQPREVRLQAVPKSGRTGFSEYEGVSPADQASFVGVELKVSFGPGEKVHTLHPAE